MVKENRPEKLIADLDNEVQRLWSIKENCNLKGLQDIITGTTKSISDFEEIRDTSLVNSEEEKEFDNLLSEYHQILLKLEECKCIRTTQSESFMKLVRKR